jgi:hypothetical protein
MDEFDYFELALFCGGPVRVVQTALFALHEKGRIRISRGRHRVEVVRRESDDRVEAAVLAEIPHAGRPLGQVVAAVAETFDMRPFADALVELKLMRPRGRRATYIGWGLRRRIIKNGGDEPSAVHRVAIIGPAGIEDAGLREILEARDPKPIKLRRGRRRGHDHLESSGLADTQYYGDGGGSGY